MTVWRALLVIVPAAALAAATSCTNPFPQDEVPYDTSLWDSAVDTASETDADTDTD